MVKLKDLVKDLELGKVYTDKDRPPFKVTEAMNRQQADELRKQLGGNKFITMTGAKKFSFGSQGLGFRIGKNSKGINYVRIDLKSNDLYDMEFIRIRGTKVTVVKKETGVYNDQLQKIFTKHTGMYTRL